MTRFTALLFLTLALAFSGCKKGSPKVAENDTAEPVAAAEKVSATEVATGETAPPTQPDFAPVPAATPKPAARPQVDSNASAIVFCYHNIEDTKSKNLTIPVAQFRKEMQGIKDAGFTVIGMQDFLAWRRGEKNIPAKSCIITIDDGWVSGYTQAWPVLKEFGYPFTMFIYVHYVGSGGKSLSWAQLGEMRDGGVDIQSHTYYHGNLKNPETLVDKTTLAAIRKDIAALGKDGYFRKEIIESKKVLEEQLGIKVNALAYPFGNWNQNARDLVKQAGYEAAFTVYGQKLNRSSPYDLLGRYAIDVGNPKIFTDALAMVGGGGGGGEALPNTVGQLAQALMVTQPLNGETIMDPKPTLKANLSSLGDIEPGSLEVRLSGVGVMVPQFDAATKMMTVPVTQKLAPGNYTVIVAVRSEGVRKETRWSFTVGQSAASLLNATPAPAPAPAPAEAAPAIPAKATPKKKK